jgi:hypothetical protein
VTPQEIQMAAMANLMKLQGGGGQGMGPSRPMPASGATSRIDPVMRPPGMMPDEGPTGGPFGSRIPDEGPTGGGVGLDAILRRLGGGGANSPVPGEHVGMSELGQSSGLMDIINLLTQSQRMQSPTSMIPGVGPGIGIEEDMPQWDWKTMGNQRRGVTDPLSGKKRIETSNAPRVGRAGRAK